MAIPENLIELKATFEQKDNITSTYYPFVGSENLKIKLY